MGLAESATLVASLNLEGNFGTKLAAAQRQLGTFSSNMGRVGKGVGQLAGGLVRLGAVAATAAAGGLLAGAKAAASFEAQLATINTIAQENATGLTKIGDGIRQLARQGGADLGDLTNGYYDILSAGIATADAQALLTKAWELGRGTLGSTSQGVDVLTTAINSYQGTALYAGKTTAQLAALFSDQLAVAVRDGKLTLDDIGSSFADIAPVAAIAGIGLDQIAASYGTITAKGSQASEVATQMTRAIIEILKPSADLDALQKKLGINFQDVVRQKGLVPALQDIRTAAQKTGIPFQDLFGRLEGLKFVLNTTGVNFDNYGKELKKVRTESGVLAEQVSARNKGLAFAFGVLKANVLDAAISFGSGFTPALERLADKATAFLQKNRQAFVSFGEDVGRAIDKIDFDGLLDSAKGLARTFRDDVLPVLKAGLALFQSLPGPVQGLTTALAVGANTPVVGGALSQVGKGAANIGIGLVGALTSALGQVLPGKLGSAVGAAGGLTAQRVYVVNFPPGLGAGALGGAVGGKLGGVGSLLKATIVGAVLVEGFSLWAQSITDAVAQNNALADQGMTPEQITNYKYNHGDAAYRTAADKHGYGPNSGQATLPNDGRAPQGLSPDPIVSFTAAATSAALIGVRAGERASLAPGFAKGIIDSVATAQTTLEAVLAGIKERSAARSGGTGLGKAAVDATFRRDMERQARAIETGNLKQADQIAGLQRIQGLLSQHGDATLAAQIGAEIARIRLTVNANITVSSRDIIQQRQISLHYGALVGVQ